MYVTYASESTGPPGGLSSVPTYHLPVTPGTYTFAISTGSQSSTGTGDIIYYKTSPYIWAPREPGGAFAYKGDGEDGFHIDEYTGELIWKWSLTDTGGSGGANAVIPDDPSLDYVSNKSTTSDPTVSYSSSNVALSVSGPTIPTYTGLIPIGGTGGAAGTALSGTLQVTIASGFATTGSRILTFDCTAYVERQGSGSGYLKTFYQGPYGRFHVSIDPGYPAPSADASASAAGVSVASSVTTWYTKWDAATAQAGVSIVSLVPLLSHGIRTAGDQADMAQDLATGRITCVKSVAGILQAEVWEGWQNLTGTPARALTAILDSAGSPISGQYPSLWILSEEGRHSLCYQDAGGVIVRRDSLDGLMTLQ